MVALKRISNSPYQCTTELHPISEVANLEKKVPLSWMTVSYTHLGGLHVDDHQMVAPEVPDQSCRRVHHKACAADDQGIRCLLYTSRCV